MAIPLCDSCHGPLEDCCNVCGAPQCCPGCCIETTKEIIAAIREDALKAAKKIMQAPYNYNHESIDAASEILRIAGLPK